MRSRRSAFDRKLPRFRARRDSTLNQISTWFSHDVCLGTYTNRIRWLASFKNSFRVATDFNTPLFPFTPSGSTGNAHSPATNSTSVAEQCVVKLSATKIHPAFGSVAMARPMWAAKSASVRVSYTVGAITSPVATSKFAVKHCDP